MDNSFSSDSFGTRVMVRIPSSLMEAYCITFSLGLILSQVIFLAYMVILKKTANVAVSAILIVFTAFVKMTYVFSLRGCE